MIDPLNIRQPYEYLVEPQKVIKIDELPDYDLQDWDLNDPKEYIKYIKALEKTVRGSFEYRAMVSYLKQYANMTECAFYKNVSNADTSAIKIEIHHGPFSLCDICEIVYRKRLSFGEPLDEFMTAKEVMYLHYNMCIGLIPLSATVHELVGNRYLFISPRNYYGNYKYFAECYRQWILPEQFDTLERLESTPESEYEDIYKTLLSKQYIYADMSGMPGENPSTQEIIGMLKGRIGEIVEGNTIKLDN